MKMLYPEMFVGDDDEPWLFAETSLGGTRWYNCYARDDWDAAWRDYDAIVAGADTVAGCWQPPDPDDVSRGLPGLPGSPTPNDVHDEFGFGSAGRGRIERRQDVERNAHGSEELFGPMA